LSAPSQTFLSPMLLMSFVRAYTNVPGLMSPGLWYAIV
jgi:hypothetical protein